MRQFIAVAALALTLATSTAQAADPSLKTERQKLGYMVGMDIGKSIAPAGPDLDRVAFDKALRNAVAGNKVLVSGDSAKRATEIMQARIAERKAGNKPGALPKDVSKQTISYLVGHAVGLPLIEIKTDVDMTDVIKGAFDRIGGGKTKLSDDEALALRNAFIEKQAVEGAKEAAKYKADNAAYLAKNKTQEGVVTTPSGLQYKVIKTGAGAAPIRSSVVRVFYEGKLIDGTVFDASKQEPAEFPLNRVIQGWTEGLQLMKPGSKYRFFIPSYLGYGEKGAPGSIPPNSTLVFDVELVSVVR